MADFTVTGRAYFGRDAFAEALQQANNIAGGRPFDVLIANLPSRTPTEYGDIEFPVTDGLSVCVLDCSYITSPVEGVL